MNALGSGNVLGIALLAALFAGVMLGALFLIVALRERVAVNRKIDAISGRVILERELELIRPEPSDRVTEQTILRILPSLEATRLGLRRAGLRFDVRLYVFVVLVISAAIALLYDNPLVPTAIDALEPLVNMAALHALLSGMILRYLVKRRQRRIVEQLVPVVEHIARALRVGQGVEDSIRSACQITNDPLGSELKVVMRVSSVGVPIDRALMTVAREIDVPELTFLAAALAAQAESGGNLSVVLGNLADVIRTRFQLIMKINAMTAEGKVSAYMLAALPILILFYLSLVNPEFVAPLYEKEAGTYILGAGLGIIATGLVVMLRIVKIRI